MSFEAQAKSLQTVLDVIDGQTDQGFIAATVRDHYLRFYPSDVPPSEIRKCVDSLSLEKRSAARLSNGELCAPLLKLRSLMVEDIAKCKRLLTV